MAGMPFLSQNVQEYALPSPLTIHRWLLGGTHLSCASAPCAPLPACQVRRAACMPELPGDNSRTVLRAALYFHRRAAALCMCEKLCCWHLFRTIYLLLSPPPATRPALLLHSHAMLCPLCRHRTRASREGGACLGGLVWLVHLGRVSLI